MKKTTIVVAVLVALALAAVGITTNHYLIPEPALAQFADDDIVSSSTSASATVELTLTIASLPMDLVDGSSVVLYLEDDYGVPDGIGPHDVYFIVPGSTSQRTNNGGRVYAEYAVEISDDDHFGGGDDWDIRVFVPDFDTRNVNAAAGFQAPLQGEPLQLVIEKAAGITNPSEAHDSNNTYTSGYWASYAVLGPNADVPDAPTGDDELNNLFVRSKISLSDEDNTRGYQLTVTGSGFNNGTSAAVHVLHKDGDAPSCAEILTQGARAGIAIVGSDDKVAVTFEVTVPTFMAGANNYICMVDGEGRMSGSDVEQFELQPSLRVAPASVAVGETVTVYAQDFPVVGASFEGIRLANQSVTATTSTSIRADGSGTASFEVPSSYRGRGTLRVDATWGGIRKSARITVTDAASSPPVSDPLTAPTDLTAAAGDQSGTVNLNWSAPAGAQYHFVAWIPQDATDINQASVLPVSAEGQATITDLNPGTTYIFFVIAGRWEWAPDFGAKWSPWSSWVSVTALP